MFAVLLHAHLAGRGIRLRHFRKGKEMKLLAYDDDFDFNFQEFQYLKEEQTILPVCVFLFFFIDCYKSHETYLLRCGKVSTSEMNFSLYLYS